MPSSLGGGARGDPRLFRTTRHDSLDPVGVRGHTGVCLVHATALRSFFWCWNVTGLHAFFDELAHLPEPPQVCELDVQTPQYALQSLRVRARTDHEAEAVQTLEQVFTGGRSAYAARTPGEKKHDLAQIDSLSILFAGQDVDRERRHLQRVQACGPWATNTALA